MSQQTWKSPAALAGILMVVILLLAGCDQPAAPAGTPVSTNTPTVTPTATELPVVATANAEATKIIAAANSSASSKATPAAIVTPDLVPTRAPVKATAVPMVDQAALIEELVTGVMGEAPAGSAEQLATLEQNARNISTEIVETQVAYNNDQILDNDLDLTNEVVLNNLLAVIVQRAFLKGVFCWADKTATWSENYGPDGKTYLGPQRLEISQQQQNVSHLDYYRGPGVAAISILVRGGEEAVLLGNGSLWEYPGDRCQGFDFLEDLELYASGPRPEWGHSQLVFANLSDALSGQPAYNPQGLTSAEIDQLRPILFQENPAQLASVRAVTGFQPNDREAACEARREDHPPVEGQPWTVSAGQGQVVLNFWSNWPGIATAGESKILFPVGTTVSLRGGGSAFFYPPGCGDVAAQGYAENMNTPWTLNGPEMAPYIVLQ